MYRIIKRISRQEVSRATVLFYCKSQDLFQTNGKDLFLYSWLLTPQQPSSYQSILPNILSNTQTYTNTYVACKLEPPSKLDTLHIFTSLHYLLSPLACDGTQSMRRGPFIAAAFLIAIPPRCDLRSLCVSPLV